MGLFGPPNIEKLKARKNVKGLIRALKDEDQEAAAGALGNIGKPAVESLIATLKDESANV